MHDAIIFASLAPPFSGARVLFFPSFEFHFTKYLLDYDAHLISWNVTKWTQHSCCVHVPTFSNFRADVLCMRLFFAATTRVATFICPLCSDTAHTHRSFILLLLLLWIIILVARTHRGFIKMAVCDWHRWQFVLNDYCLLIFSAVLPETALRAKWHR